MAKKCADYAATAVARSVPDCWDRGCVRTATSMFGDLLHAHKNTIRSMSLAIVLRATNRAPGKTVPDLRILWVGVWVCSSLKRIHTSDRLRSTDGLDPISGAMMWICGVQVQSRNRVLDDRTGLPQQHDISGVVPAMQTIPRPFLCNFLVVTGYLSALEGRS